MPIVRFTRNLQRHVACPTGEFPGNTLREVLNACFSLHPRVRGYVLDDQGALRHHMAIFIDGRQIADPVRLSDPVAPSAQIDIIQALSGG